MSDKDTINQEQDDIAIRVNNLSKCYQIYDTPRDRLKQFILPRVQHAVGRQPAQYFREFWALKDVSFEVRKGETVGIIGRNGSGKSTLLQMICGTLNPTSGSITTHGRIAALLELGSGFNPEFTGRENVYMNASVLGLSKEEIDQRFDDIVAFADIGEFIEQPVKTYSSGMMVRLAFAVQAQVDPDILIVDEALSVGDIRFQIKCLRAIENLRNQGATIAFVSHSQGQIEAICDQVVWIDKGNLKGQGTPKDMMRRYINYVVHNIDNSNQSEKLDLIEKPYIENIENKWVSVTEKYNTAGSKLAEIKKISITKDNESLATLYCGEVKITVSIIIDVYKNIHQPLVAIGILNSLNELIVHFNTECLGKKLQEFTGGTSYLIRILFPIPAVKPGNYLISIGLDDGFSGSSIPIFHIYDAWIFSVIQHRGERTQAGYIQIVSDDILIDINKYHEL